jgi:gas vesicle protein
VSDRDGGAGYFLLGLVAGALLGLAFAPAAGAETRTAIARRVRELRDLAEEKVDDIGELIGGGEEEGEEEDGEEDPAAGAAAAREELRQRLADAGRRRRGARGSPRAALGPAEGDEPAP